MIKEEDYKIKLEELQNLLKEVFGLG